VDEYGPKGQWRELGAVLDRMDRHRLPASEQEMWYRARGIVEFRTNHRARAREIFEEGVAQFPTSGWLNYGLGQEYEAQGRIDEMAACFRHVRLENVGSPTVLAMARYYYLWNRFELGQLVIQPIFDRYYELKIADDMFLYMRGLPMFDESFGYRATFARLAGKLDQARYELARARTELSDVTVDHHELDLDATRTGNWEAVLADLESRLKSLDARTAAGQLWMKRAVLRIRAMANFAPALAGEGRVGTALAELEAVKLTPDDHAWLADVRTLARAELFHRLDMLDREQSALAEFWPRQAMLFEPNHAFNFGFIDYQETLKPHYQSQRHP
jgi:tetratricopeptide (TPR) repeat protein